MRPRKYDEDTVVCLSSSGSGRLQKMSDRRAIVDLLIEHGGCMSIGAINAHFRFSMRQKVIALVRSGWLTVREEVAQ